MDLATKKMVEGSAIVLHAPLIEKSKADIVKTGMELEVDYGLTVSCYQADAEETPGAYVIVVASGSKGVLMLSCVIRLPTGERCKHCGKYPGDLSFSV